MNEIQPTDRYGAVADRTLPDGRVCVVEPLLFGRGRLGVDADAFGYKDVW